VFGVSGVSRSVLERFLTGVTVLLKYSAQSAEPCLVGKALANRILLHTDTNPRCVYEAYQ